MNAWLPSAGEWSAIRLSVQVALVAVACSLPLGVATAWLLARRNFWGKAAFETLVFLPLALPPIVTGYLLLVTFGKHGWIGSWLGVQFVFDWKGAAVASAIMAFPLMVRSMRVAIAAVDVRLELAARTLGAAPLDAFFSVTLPLAWHGVIAGCLLAFARSMGEFGATIMIAGNTPGLTQTIPLYIYSQLESPGGASVARVVCLSIAIAAVTIFIGERLDRRSVRTG